ncbi:MAG: hypothetical protein LBR53_01415 [Deltaproteobacteria bacterium]|jgi:hypothetical protein|nr:hypothetical protein [Deltaproteobacteria bacterium]
MTKEGVLENLLPHLQALWGTIGAVIVFLGFILFLWNVYLLSVSSGRPSRGRIILSLFCGVLLLNIGELLDALAFSLFQTESARSLSYVAPDHPAKSYIEFAFHLVALVGLVGVGKGVLILKDGPERPGRLGLAAVYVISGILCVNLESALKMIGRSMGRETLNLITAITG